MEVLPQIKGMIQGIPNKDYHSSDYISYSNLKLLFKSPELYKKHADKLIPHEDKDAWKVGNAVHTAILEPEKMGQYCLVEPDYNGASKDGKALKKECNANGVELLNAKNSYIVRGCIDSLKSNNAIKLFQHGEAEVSFRAESKHIKLQCRTDWICHSAPAGLDEFGIYEGERYVADLKTTRSIDDWLNTSKYKNPLINDLYYAGQEAFYTTVINSLLRAANAGEVDKWLFVVVEKEEPFRVVVVRADQVTKDRALIEVGDKLAELVSRTINNNWTDSRLIGVIEPELF